MARQICDNGCQYKKRVTLAAKGAKRKLEYEDVKACQLEVIADLRSERPRCVCDLVRTKLTSGLSWAIA